MSNTRNKDKDSIVSSLIIEMEIKIHSPLYHQKRHQNVCVARNFTRNKLSIHFVASLFNTGENMPLALG